MFKLSGEWVWQSNGILKLIALLINLIVMCLLSAFDYEPLVAAFQGEFHSFALTVVTSGGYIIAHCILIFGYCFDDTFGEAHAQEIITELVGAILSASVGALLFWSTVPMTIQSRTEDLNLGFKPAYPVNYLLGILWICTVLMFANAIVFLLDACCLLYHAIRRYYREKRRRRNSEKMRLAPRK